MSTPETGETAAGRPGAGHDGSAESTAVRSAAMAGATNVLLLLVKLVSSAWLARLLTTRDFGIASLAWVVLTAVVLLSDVGLDTAVVRSERGEDPDFLDVVWSVGLARAGILWLALLALAMPLASFYGEPRFAAILPVIGLVLVLEAGRSPYLDVAERRLDQTPRMRLEVLGALSAFVVQIAFAYAFPSPWALVAGALVASTLRCLESHRLNDGRRNRLAWDPEVVSEIVGFGKWVFVSTAFTFFATQGDRLLLGKVMSLDLLGVYGIACTVALIPSQIHQVVASRVVFPLIVTFIRDTPERLEARLRQARSLLLAVMLLPMVGVVMLARPLFELVYPGRFELAGTLAPIVACISWVGILQNSVDRLPLAHGEGRVVALVSFVSMVARLSCGLVGFHLHGLFGFLGGLLVGAVVEYAAAHVIAIRRYGIHLIGQDVRYTTGLVAAVLILVASWSWSFGARVSVAGATVLVASVLPARAVLAHLRRSREAREASISIADVTSTPDVTATVS